MSLYNWVFNDLNLLIYHFKSESCFATRNLHLISSLSVCIELSFFIHFSNIHSTWYRFEFLSTFTPLYPKYVRYYLLCFFFCLLYHLRRPHLLANTKLNRFYSWYTVFQQTYHCRKRTGHRQAAWSDYPIKGSGLVPSVRPHFDVGRSISHLVHNNMIIRRAADNTTGKPSRPKIPN